MTSPFAAPQSACSIVELPSQFLSDTGVIRLLEDRDLDPGELLNNLLSDEYDRPFVFDNGLTRTLYFSSKYVQSRMLNCDPISLNLAYTRKMMGFLLFKHQPRNILMLGLGGGSLAKYCYSHLPLSKINVVEIDPYVIGFREQFFIPADDSRFRVIHDDAAKYIEQCPFRPDVMLLDAFDRNGFSSSINFGEFYHKARSLLSPSGLLVANLAGSKEERLAHIKSIREVFDNNLLILQTEDDGNHVLIAFRNGGFEPLWRSIESQAKKMQVSYRIDFPLIAQKLERSRKLSYIERMVHAQL